MSKKNTTSLSSQRNIYVLLGFLIMICLGTVYSWSVFRLHVQEIYQIGSTESGLPYMTSLAFYALFMFLTGKILDRYSPKLVISVGGLLIALGWISAAFAPNIFIFTFFYGVVSGTGVGIAYGVPLALTSKWFPQKKGLAVGLVLVGFGLSPLVTAPIARQLIVMMGAMKTFMVLGVSFGILIPLLSFPLSYPKLSGNAGDARENHAAKDDTGVDTDEMIHSKAFKTLYINFFIGATIGLMMIGMTSSVGIGFSKLPPETVYSLLPLFAIFNGVGRPLFGWLTDRTTAARAMNYSYALIILAAVLMLFSGNGSALAFAVSFSIFWLNLGGWLAIAPGATISLFGPRHYSQNYGVVFTAYGIGAITGVLASGALLDVLNDYRMIFGLVIALCISGILFSRKMEA
ncbi:MAG: MFS transporter [Clostridiales bacterium]|nr:MAG: MFS transporter [Clostridiales bacterium]